MNEEITSSAAAIPPIPPEIAGAISQVMREIEPVAKKGYNTEHKYKFVAIGDLLGEIQPLMATAGLIIIQREKSFTWYEDGAFVAITYDFSLAHQGGATWRGDMPQTGLARFRFKSGGVDDKAFNKCHTAARKYFLMALFQIPSGDISDTDKDGGDGQEPAAAERVAKQESAEAQRWAQTAKDYIGRIKTADDLRKWKVRWTIP